LIEGDEAELECPSCFGKGCEKCDDGNFFISGCPNKYCNEVINAVNLIDLFEKGLPPIAGGSLDQSVWFMEAASFIQAEDSRIKAESNR
jgi:hypothetical protein